jgi:hypothetical protein
MCSSTVAFVMQQTKKKIRIMRMTQQAHTSAHPSQAKNQCVSVENL